MLLLVRKKWHFYFQECCPRCRRHHHHHLVIAYFAYCWLENGSLIFKNKLFRIWCLLPTNHPPFHFLFVLFCLTAPPSIMGNHRTPENISVVEKNSVSLTCEASGIPLPSITWLKDGCPVNFSSSLRILSGIRNSCNLVTWLASCGHSFSLISHNSMSSSFLYDLAAYYNPHWSY